MSGGLVDRAALEALELLAEWIECDRELKATMLKLTPEWLPILERLNPRIKKNMAELMALDPATLRAALTTPAPAGAAAGGEEWTHIVTANEAQRPYIQALLRGVRHAELRGLDAMTLRFGVASPSRELVAALLDHRAQVQPNTTMYPVQP